MEKAALGAIASVGIIGMAILAPNAIQALEQTGLIKRRNYTKRSANRAIERLLEKGWISIEQTPRGKMVRLTGHGEAILRIAEASEYKFKKPKRWDKKWRIIIFDVSEKRRSTREKLRLTLIQIGFIRLQNSVWVYPYDCEDLIKLLKADFKIGKDVLYIIADSVENDSALRKSFSL